MNYSNIYTKIIEYRRNNEPTGYYETHHILPRCLGGTDNKDNLVKLTAKEHFICHLLLTKMYLTNTPAHYKMCKAFLMMQVGNTEQGRHFTGLTYSKLKKEHRAYMSAAQQGHKNHQYGTKWVSNLELQKR